MCRMYKKQAIIKVIEIIGLMFYHQTEINDVYNTSYLTERPYMTDPVVTQNSPYKVDVKEGEKYAWCACGLSTNQPFCDGTHKQTDDLKPLVFLSKKDETVFLYGCKQPGDSPACDGAHKSL